MDFSSFTPPSLAEQSLTDPTTWDTPREINMSLDTLLQDLQRARMDEVNVIAPPSDVTVTALSVVRDIGYELYQGVAPNNDRTRGDEYKTHESRIKDTLTGIRTVQTRFQEQIQKVQVAGDNVKASFELTQKSIREIDQIVVFLENLTDHGKETDNIKTLIVDLSKSIRDKDTSRALKDSYENELELLQLYVHGFLKEVNGLNIGNTCPLCLQRPVTKYMNPCGHTGCDECMSKLNCSSDVLSKCFMCRAHISEIRNLYFC
tara:strand:- start:1137 stop:1919 length:783 start_codon:yes stop_codon:yes gene_type:complete